MANPVFGEGTVLEVNDGVASAFVSLDDVSEVDPPEAAAIEVERNRLSVTTMKERAFSSRLDPGEMTFVYEDGYTKFARVEALKNVEKSYRVTLTDGKRVAFSGVLKSNKAQRLAGEQIAMVNVVVRMTSLVTLSDTSP